MFYLRLETIWMTANHGGKRYRLSTKLVCEPRNWDSRKERVKPGASLALETNAELEAMRHRMAQLLAQLNLERKPLTSQLIEERVIQGVPQHVPKLVDVLNEYLEAKALHYSPHTLKMYRVTVKYLRLWMGEIYPQQWDTERLQAWLKLGMGKGWAMVHTRKHVKRIHTALRYAMQTGRIPEQVIPRWVGGATAAYKVGIALTADELSHIGALELPQYLASVRDWFLLGCYTGVRFGDLGTVVKAKPEQVGGMQLLKVYTNKTDETVWLPYTPQVAALQQRLKGQTPPTNQHLNRCLKEIGQLAGLTQTHLQVKTIGHRQERTEIPRYELLTTHVARRTFITLSAEKGVRLEAIQKVVGHKQLKQTAEYLRVSQQQAAQELAEKWQTGTGNPD